MADSRNLFRPIFQSRESLSDLYDRTLSLCAQYKSELAGDRTAQIADIFPQLVKRNDTNVRLGRVKFAAIEAEQVLVDQVNSSSR